MLIAYKVTAVFLPGTKYERSGNKVTMKRSGLSASKQIYLFTQVRKMIG